MELYLQILLAIISGGVITKVLSLFFFSKKEKQDATLSMIAEMQRLLNYQSERIDELQGNLSERDKQYQALQMEYEELKLRFDKIKAETDRIKKKYPELILQENN